VDRAAFGDDIYTIDEAEEDDPNGDQCLANQRADATKRLRGWGARLVVEGKLRGERGTTQRVACFSQKTQSHNWYVQGVSIIRSNCTFGK
jgi:hypothetical protein